MKPTRRPPRAAGHPAVALDWHLVLTVCMAMTDIDNGSMPRPKLQQRARDLKRGLQETNRARDGRGLPEAAGTRVQESAYAKLRRQPTPPLRRPADHLVQDDFRLDATAPCARPTKSIAS
jgi:hypothetical protein